MGKSFNSTVRKPRRSSDDVLEPNQRLVIAVVAAGMIIGALLTHSSNDAPAPATASVASVASK